MKVAVAGKGGSGKTTIAATLARLLARRGRSVLAVDGDSNPNLAVCLGLPRARSAELPTLPRDLLEGRTREDGSRYSVLTKTPAEICAEWGVVAPDGVTLLVMGRVGHAGAG